MRMLIKCDSIAMHPNWEQSEGSVSEHAWAVHKNFEILYHVAFVKNFIVDHAATSVTRLHNTREVYIFCLPLHPLLFHQVCFNIKLHGFAVFARIIGRGVAGKGVFSQLFDLNLRDI